MDIALETIDFPVILPKYGKSRVDAKQCKVSPHYREFQLRKHLVAEIMPDGVITLCGKMFATNDYHTGIERKPNKICSWCMHHVTACDIYAR